MEAYLSTLIQQSGASGFLIVRDDAALTMSPPTMRTKRTKSPRFSSSSVSLSLSSSASTPCIGPPCLPRRKRSSDDIFSISKGSARRSAKKAANNRVLKAFFDEVMGPVAASSSKNKKHRRRSEIEFIDDALSLTPVPRLVPLSTKETSRWDSNPSRHHSM